MRTGIEVTPATAWPDVEHVFEGDAAARKCFCRWQKWTNAEYAPSSPEERRAALRLEVEGGDSPGVVAYQDGEAVGWCAVQSRPAYRRLPATKAVAAEAQSRGDDLADPGTWAIVCFVVRKEARGAGVATALLRAAVEAARTAGARRIVAYPTEGGTGAAALNTGTASMFTKAGFTVVGERAPGKPVVELLLG